MRIVIVGDGKIGSALAEQLSREGHEITIVDRSETPLQRTVEDLDILSIEGNGATYATQMEAGVDEAELVIAVTAQDELNLLCCLIAKKIGAKHTIARVRNPEYAEELSLISDDLGLSLSVNPELICATEMARTLRTPSAIKTDTFFGGKVELLKFQLPADSPLAGKTLMELPAVTKAKVLICAVERGENRFELKACEKAIRAQFGEERFASLPRNNPAASLALGALLSYLHETQKTDLSYIKDLEYYEQGRFMELDLSARRNLELTESLRDFCRLQMLSTLQRDPKNLDLKTDLMVEFTVGGMLAVLQRWPELSDTIEIKDLLKEDVAVLAMGIYLAMSQKDMLNYWNRIFVHNAQDSTAPGMPVAATHAAPSTISSSNGPAGFPGYTA